MREQVKKAFALFIFYILYFFIYSLEAWLKEVKRL